MFPFRRRAVVAIMAAAVLIIAWVAPATAAAPSGDRRSAAIVIDAIPYTQSLDTTDATSSPTDPGYCFSPELGPDAATVWFTYTAATSGPLGATTFGSDYDTTLYVLTNGAQGKLAVIACGDDSRTLQSALRFDAVAGETYYFVVGTSPFAGLHGGNLVFNLDVGPVAQVVDLEVEATATLSRGVITIYGTVSCSAPADLGSLVIAEVEQTTVAGTAAGVGFLDVAGCPGTNIPFAISVESEIGTWKRGEATAQILYAACNQFECGNETVDLVLTVER